MTFSVAVNAYATAEIPLKFPVYDVDYDGRGIYWKEFSGIFPEMVGWGEGTKLIFNHPIDHKNISMKFHTNEHNRLAVIWVQMAGQT